jgi:predicted transcriptional regulator
MTTITIHLRDGPREVEATIIDTLAVHQEVDGNGWNVAHAATGMTFGITQLRTEAEATEAAHCVLANAALAHVLEAETQDEAVSRGEAMTQEGAPSVQAAVRAIHEGLVAEWTKRLTESGAILTPEMVVDLIEREPSSLAEVEHFDEVLEGIEQAGDDVQWQVTDAIREVFVGDFVSHYAEPGYTDPAGLIFMGDWNGKGGDELVRILEVCGNAIEWCDEWATCCACAKAVRTQADSYCWTRSYVEWSGELTCHECMEDDDNRRAYIEEELEGDSDHADTLDWDLAGLGYVRMDEDFQSGLYGGQSASPRKIADALRERGVERFVFQIDSVGQFDARFSCWLHEDEDMPVLGSGETDGPDPVVQMKSAFADAKVKEAALPPGPGVVVTTCNADGTATVNRVSDEDFIAGKALGGE